MHCAKAPPPHPPLKGALIGCGNAAVHAHLPIWKQSGRFRIDAVVEPLKDGADRVSRLLPGIRIHSEVESLLACGDLDFVDICTPPCFHADLMLKACEAGLHVFCEKPLVCSPDELHRIRRHAETRGQVVFMVNNWKHAPLWVKLRELLEQDRIGRVRAVSLSVLRSAGSGGGVSDWRRSCTLAGGGILLDHGWHQLYLALSLIDDDPIWLSARMRCAPGQTDDLEDEVELDLGFPDAAARLYLTWRSPVRRNEGRITGERGTLSINDDHLVLDADGLAPVRYDFSEALSAGSHHPEWMRPVVEDFYREIVDPTVRGGNFREAAWCRRLTDLAYRSHRQGSSRVPIDSPEP